VVGKVVMWTRILLDEPARIRKFAANLPVTSIKQTNRCDCLKDGHYWSDDTIGDFKTVGCTAKFLVTSFLKGAQSFGSVLFSPSDSESPPHA
jgi:hypothetical protein